MTAAQPSSAVPRPLLGRAARALNRMGYLRKWLILGALIGIVAGLGAIVFIEALRGMTRLLLGGIGGYTPPAPVGEGNSAGSAHFARPWAIPLVVALGGLVSGLLVFSFAPEAEGHGTDAAIEAVHENPRGIRSRVSVIKILASAFTIGSGGSGGREGPTAQISAGFGSLLARWLELSPAEARIAVTVGIGSGIGAIFRAPLGGAVLGAEILYRDDVEVEAIIPSFVASIVGFAIFGAVEGFTPIFGALRGYHFTRPIELVYYAALGIAAGIVGVVYSWAFYGTIRLTRRISGRPTFKPAVAGLIVGMMALALPGVVGTGYGWVQRVMNDPFSISLWVILLLPFAKIAATSLSIGSGGSGGIFGPGMVIGGFLGAALWRLLSPVAPGVPASAAPFVVVGMVACFGSIAHAPLAVLLMVAEMTGSLELLAPGMVAVGIATLVVGDRTIYSSQLRSRADAPAHRVRFGMPLLAAVPVREALAPPRLVISAEITAEQALGLLQDAGLRGAPVVDEAGLYVGTVTMDRLDPPDGDTPIRSLVDDQVPFVDVDGELGEVAEAIAAHKVDWVPIVDHGHRVVGIVAASDLINGYREVLRRSLSQLSLVPPRGTSLFEESIGPGSPLVGRTIAEGGWLRGSLVVTIQRSEQLLFPRGGTVLMAGDELTVLAAPENVDQLRLLVRGSAEGGQEPEPGPDLI